MTKKISFVLAVILFFNFIIPCFIHRSFADGVRNIGVIDGSARAIYTGKDAYDDGLNPSEYSVIKFQVAQDGLYRFNCSYAGTSVDYSILNSSNTPMAIAGYVRNDNQNPTVDASMANKNTRTVTVYLKAGQTYTAPMYESLDGWDTTQQVVWSIDKVESPGPDYSIKEFQLSSDEYTNHNNRGVRTVNGQNVHRGDVAYSDPGSKISQGSFTVAKGSSIEDLVGNQSVSAIEKLATFFFIYGVCEPLRILIASSFGAVSIDSLLFNEYSPTRLTFYRENGRYTNEANSFITNASGGSKTVLDMIDEYYALFRGIAIIIYIGLLVYIAVRILLKSTARDKEKFKSMLADWVRGVAILFIFPFIIKYTILINEALVSLIKEQVRDTVFSGQDTSFMPSSTLSAEDLDYLNVLNTSSGNNDLMQKYKEYALTSHSMGFAFVYFYLLISLFSFLMIYFKRLITILFLIVLFPFVAISYAVDKVKDGKAQIFNNWFRELILNIFMQLFHAIAYITVMAIILAFITADGGPNVLFVIIGIGYIKKSDELLKILFPTAMRGGGGGSVKSLSQVAKTAAAVSIYKQTTSNLSNMGKRVETARAKHHNAVVKRNESWSRTHEVKIGEQAEKAAQKNEQNKNNAMTQIGGTVITPGTIAQQGSANSPGPLPSGIGTGGAQASTGGGTGSGASSTGGSSTGGGNAPGTSTTPRPITGGATTSSISGGTTTIQQEITMEQVDAIAKVYNSNDKDTREKLKRDLEAHGILGDRQKKVMDLVQAKVAFDELVTGKSAKGVIKSRAELAINVKVVTDLLERDGPNPEVGSASHTMRQYIAGKQVSYLDYEYMYKGQKLESKEEFLRIRSELTNAGNLEDLARLKIGEKKAVRTLPAEQFLEKAKKETLVETEAQVQQLRSASHWMGDLSGVSEPTIAETRDEITGQVVSREVKDLEGAVAPDGNLSLDSVRTQRISTAGRKLGDMSGKEKNKLHARNSEKIERMREKFMGSRPIAATGTEHTKFTEAAHILLDLKEYQDRMSSTTPSKKIDGVAPAEMHRLVSRLNELQKENESVKAMVEAMVDTGQRDATGASTFRPDADPDIASGTITLGCSLDVMEAKSAAAVFALDPEERTPEDSSEMKKAGESLRRLDRESSDDLARTILNRSERDDVIDAGSVEEVLDSDGFIEGEEDTQEQKLYDKYVEERVTVKIKLSKDARAKLRAEAIRATVESTGAIVSATAGNVASVGTGLSTAALIGGAQAQTSATDIMASYNVGQSVERSVERFIPGTDSATKGTIGNRTAELVQKVSADLGKKGKSVSAEMQSKVEKSSIATQRARLFAKNLKDKK